MTRIRCSSLPLVSACPASLDAELPVNAQTPEASLGTAVHDFLAAEIAGAVNAAFVPADQGDEFRMLTTMGLRCWSQLRHYFPAPAVEKYLEAPMGTITLTGHADVYSLELQPTDGVGEVRILDWKTGRDDLNYDDQLRGYALLGLEHCEHAESASVALVRVREQTVDWGHYTRNEIYRWWNGLAARVNGRHDFAAGRHCGFCPRSPACPAKTAMLTQAVTALIGVDSEYGDSMLMTPDALALLLDRAKLIEKACESARDLVRAEVIARGGRIATADGRELFIAAQERKSIEYAQAVEILLEELGADALTHTLSVSKTKVEEAVRAKAGRGRKQQAVKDLFDRLAEAGAIRTETTERLEVRRAVAALAAKGD